MRRFPAIEGARAWLAWVVALAHMSQFAGLFEGLAYRLTGLSAKCAVLAFITISGFVIAHMLFERSESYPAYLVRRAFRLFPAYLVLLPLGALSAPLAAEALAGQEWAHAGRVVSLREMHAAVVERPVEQWLLHLTLLQGIVPDAVWLRTSTAMINPAWSLSLEWQFYVAAPLIVWLCGKRPAAAALIALGLYWALELMNLYHHPSFLPCALIFFVVGIIARQRLAALAPVLNWFSPLSRMLLESRFVLEMGARSYAVYVVHYPLLQIVSWLVATRVADHTIAASLIIGGSVIGTLIISHLVYEHVERPMIRFGARLAMKIQAIGSANAKGAA